MTEPRTEAGRTMLAGFAPLPLPDAQELHRRSAMGRRVKVEAGIRAIEDESWNAALAAVEDRLVGPWVGVTMSPTVYRAAVGEVIASLRKPEQSSAPTHGRHCPCSACARQDWAEPGLASCGMHGPSCPPIYAPIAKPPNLGPLGAAWAAQSRGRAAESSAPEGEK